jgi:tRNA modification GTPase
VVRISGPRALEIGQILTGRRLQPRRAHYANFRDQRGDALDAGIALYFEAPHSFTGEAVVELQGHGGPVVLGMVLDAVLVCGARLARAGEFTERAFLNGKLDLAQAEAVADLIGSASAAAARGAMRSLQGDFSDAVQAVDTALLELRVFVEAAMDFPDEQIEFLAEGQVGSRLHSIGAELATLLRNTRQGVLLRDGILIALLGPPNVGKSSLLNRLAGEPRAIVSAIPGTTRDVVHVDLVIDGLPVQVVDTAGLRESADPIEQEGVRRAREQAARADLVLVLEDDVIAGRWFESPLLPVLEEILPELDPGRILRVLNKVDQSGFEPGLIDGPENTEPTAVRISALTGAGVAALTALIKTRIGYGGEGTAYTARRRHVEALLTGARAVEAAQRLLEAGAAAELVAEELRNAQLALGAIVGTMSADDLLGEIFASFCIGK